MPWKRRLLSLTFVMKAFHQVRLIWAWRLTPNFYMIKPKAKEKKQLMKL